MSEAVLPSLPPQPLVRAKLSRDDWIMRSCMIGIGSLLVIFIVLPLYTMLSKSFEDKDEKFIGLANFIEYFSTPALFQSAGNSLSIALISTLTVISVAFIYGYALTRTCVPFKWFFKMIAIIPLLTPSLLGGISLVYWFGNQGVAKAFLLGESIYGPIGITIGSSYWVFPHALMIVITALSITDARLYEAADALRTSKIRIFFTITLPGCKYG